jgi:hypothetical protein
MCASNSSILKEDSHGYSKERRGKKKWSSNNEGRKKRRGKEKVDQVKDLYQNSWQLEYCDDQD